MKTSNKILLGTFIGILVLTSAINLMVYAKYKRGDYKPFTREDRTFIATVPLPAAKNISITALGNCEIIVSDTPRFEIQKDRAGRVSYSLKNDTLYMHGDSALTIEEMQQGGRNYDLVKLYMPAGMLIKAGYCNLELFGGSDSTHAASFAVQLSNDSELKIRQGASRDYKGQYGQLHIAGDFSKIEFDNLVVVQNLQLKLKDASVDFRAAMLNAVDINADEHSKITFTGSNFKALK